MTKTLILLPGDGIGPEVSAEVRKVAAVLTRALAGAMAEEAAHVAADAAAGVVDLVAGVEDLREALPEHRIRPLQRNAVGDGDGDTIVGHAPSLPEVGDGARSVGHCASMRLNLSADEVLTSTRAVRKRLDFDRPVEDDVVRECVSLAMQSPSGSNNMTMQFVVVRDEAKRKAIGDIYRQCYGIYSSMDGVYIRSIDKGEADANAQQQRSAPHHPSSPSAASGNSNISHINSPNISSNNSLHNSISQPISTQNSNRPNRRKNRRIKAWLNASTSQSP